MKSAAGGMALPPKVWRAVVVICLAIAFAGAGSARGSSKTSIPLPPPRPPAAALVSAAPASLHCGETAGSGAVVGDMQPPVAAREGCGIAAPILLRAISLRSGGQVAVAPPALLSCPFAEALAQWLRDDVAAAMLGDAGQLASIETAGAYDCRSRNRVTDGRLSEHATGNALDISAFVTDRAQRFEIARQAAAPGFFQSLKQSACQRFMTVLGPGSDGFHETHVHLDLQARANGSHVCQWTIN